MDVKIEVESDDKQTNEDEQEKESKEDVNTVTSDGTDSEQKQDEEKPDKEGEKPEGVAMETTESVEHVAVPIEDEAKTGGGEEETKGENAEGGEGEIKTESTEGGEAEPNQEEAVPVTSETVVTNETETGEDYSKYELDDELPWAMYRSMDTPPQRNPVEDDDDWPASEDDEDYGNLFAVIVQECAYLREYMYA